MSTKKIIMARVNGKLNKNKEKGAGKAIQHKWQDSWYFKIYDLLKSGMSKAQVCKTLGISTQTWHRWIKSKPMLQDMFQQIRHTRDKSYTNFREYVFAKLPQELKDLWEDINACEIMPSSIARIEALLDNRGVNARKHLFLYALVHVGFNPSAACTKLGITMETLKTWVQKDKKFRELVEQMHFHKANFFEQALVDLCERGDSPAIIFANKTFNKERGYGESKEIKVNGRVRHTHKTASGVKIDDLAIPLEIKKQLRDAIRSSKKGVPAPAEGEKQALLPLYTTDTAL